MNKQNFVLYKHRSYVGTIMAYKKGKNKYVYLHTKTLSITVKKDRNWYNFTKKCNNLLSSPPTMVTRGHRKDLGPLKMQTKWKN